MPISESDTRYLKSLGDELKSETEKMITAFSNDEYRPSDERVLRYLRSVQIYVCLHDESDADMSA